MIPNQDEISCVIKFLKCFRYLFGHENAELGEYDCKITRSIMLNGWSINLSFNSDSNTAGDFQTQHQFHVQRLLYITGRTGCRLETLTLHAAHKLYCTNTLKARLTL